MPPRRSIGQKRKGYNNWRDKEKKQAAAAGDDDTATAASEIVAGAEAAHAHEPSADDAAHRAEPKKPLDRRQIQLQRNYQQRKATLAAKQNEVLKQTAATLTKDLNDTNSYIDSAQRKHELEIGQMNDEVAKHDAAKKRAKKDHAVSKETYNEGVKQLRKKLNESKLKEEEATCANEKLEKENAKLRNELEENNKYIAELRNQLAEEKKRADAAIVEKRAKERDMQKQHGEKIESLKKEEKRKRDKITRTADAITRTANEISAEAHKKLQVATGKVRSAMNLKSRAEAQQKVTTENQQTHEEMMQKLVDDLETEISSLKQQLQEEMNRNSEEQEKEQNTIGTEQNKWGQNILQLVMELIVHGVPSGSINATIVSIVKLLLKDDVNIEKLPSEWYVRRARSILLTVAELLAAYEVGKQDNWGQLHTDMTTKRQIPFLDLVLSYSEGDSTKFKEVLMSCCIHPKDETAEEQRIAIVNYFEDKGSLLTKWKEKHEEMFPDDSHDIPDAASFNLTKLRNGGIVTTDTCPAAQKLNTSLVAEIEKQCAKKDEQTFGTVVASAIANVAECEEIASAVVGEGDGSASTIETEAVDAQRRVLVLTEFCHHHMRNVWNKASINKLSNYLAEELQADLSLIDPRYRVDANMNAICRAVYKMFSLNCNYAKGMGEEFLQWLKKNDPDFMLIPIARLSGSREDAIIEGACSIYWNRPMYINFLEETIGTPGCDNLLLDSLAIILRSEEICALTRVLAILHYSVSMPMRWLTAKTSELAEHNWSVRSIGRAIDIVHGALKQIKEDPKLFLDEHFMNNIFAELRLDLPEFEEYLSYIFEQKTYKSVQGRKTAKLTHKAVREELFNPQRQENIETNDLALKLGLQVAEVMLEEFVDPRKVTRHYLSEIGGKFSWAKTSEEEKKAGVGKKNNNDPSETVFAHLSREFEKGRLDSRNASANVIATYNKIFYRNEVEKSKKNADDIPNNGIFINLPDNLRQSLIALAMELNNSEKAKSKEQRELQRKTQEKKKEKAKKLAMEKAQRSYADVLHYHDLLDSDECIKTGADLDCALEALSSNTAKLAECKKQIKIWSVGAGKKEWHHPWSCKGVAYPWEDLAKHLKDEIYPHLQHFTPPKHPPSPKMPCSRTLPKLGKHAADIVAKLEEKEKFKSDLIEGAKKMKEEKFTPDGRIASIADVGDLIGHRIGMKFGFVEKSGSKSKDWCYGEVVGVTRCGEFHILWDDEFVEVGQPNITIEELDKDLFNKNAVFGWHVMVADADEPEDADDNIFSTVDGCVEDI